MARVCWGIMSDQMEWTAGQICKGSCFQVKAGTLHGSSNMVAYCFSFRYEWGAISWRYAIGYNGQLMSFSFDPGPIIPIYCRCSFLVGKVENGLLILKTKFRFVCTWITPMTAQMYTCRNDLTEQRWQRHWTAARQSGGTS